ncbi:uncharacterized mitochondrial protein-like protein [Tanacetum coccineum]|uniref:Uncharacterized mitochondrial protein-like protein n=1 Tax=Tanacetum coccineum TaxID=301880 RepID=A0ABQ4ZF46_9ASTR
MSNRHQELTSPEQTAPALASPEQTATGKDFSNPFIVGSLLKTIWFYKATSQVWMTRRTYLSSNFIRKIFLRNKARLVAQGYTQEEGINYDKVFAPIPRIEAIRLFLAYASFMGFIVYQMDVKSAFLYGTIKEEVYVCQPPGFKDLHFPDKVYKVDKALYGLHQALRAWYETLSTYLIENGFRRDIIDKNLFIKKDKGDILLVQKFDFANVKTTSTQIETNKALVKDEEAEAVDVHLYRSMIRSLMYLTASRPDIMFAVYAYARFQVTLKTSDIHAVKRIFRYLKGQPKLGLWYPRDSLFYLEAFSDSDYAGASLDRKSTTGGYHSETKHIEIRHHFIRDSYEKKLIQVIKIHTDNNVADLLTKAFDTVYKEWEDRMERAVTITSSLEAEQDNGSGPRYQVTTLGGAEAQTKFEAASKQSNDPPLSRVNTLRGGEDNMKQKELMELSIKARFRGNDASKKMQKNLLKQQYETFTIGSREELDSAYERFQHILSMLELYDAKVSLEDADLKFLRSLPSVWHVVATMIRGQPGLDEVKFDDLYNNLKVYEHELKGVSNSSSQNIAFLSTEAKGSTLKQSTADPANIPKGYTQAASSKVHTAPNYTSHLDEIICSFFSQQASMPTTHDDEDLLQIDEDAMEEINIRWQVAMITARIRKFMRKTGRPIDLKPKNGITFDKSKIECFNCQKLGHFARECRFSKYQENRANGRQEKKIVAIEDSNSKALVATDNKEDID